MGYDFVCFTETHSWRDTDPLTIYSEPPPKSDSWSGVTLCMSGQTSKYIMNTGNIGSRITYCRLRGSISNIFIVGVYIHQRNRTNPDKAAEETALSS